MNNKTRKLLLTVAAMFIAASTLFAAEVGGLITPGDMLPKLKQITGRQPKEKPEISVYLFFDPALPGVKSVLRMIDNQCVQTNEFKKSIEFFAISRFQETQTAAIGLKGFILPIFVNKDEKDSVYKQFTETEVLVPLVIVADREKIIWKGALQELDNVLTAIEKGKFSSEDQLRLEAKHKELQNAIQTSLPQVILQTAGQILATWPTDSLAIQAKLFVYETLNQTEEALKFVGELANADKTNADLWILYLDYLIRNDNYDQFRKIATMALSNFKSSPTSNLRLLSLILEQAPLTWIPLAEVKDATASAKAACEGKGGISEALSLQFSAKVAYLLTDTDTAIAEQTKAVSLITGTEYEKSAKQDLSYYQDAKKLKK